MDYGFNIVYQNIVQARGPQDLFGDLSGGDQGAQLDDVRKQYHYLSHQVHPDLHRGDAKEEHMAGEAMRVLNEFFDKAKEMIRGGSYAVSGFSGPASDSNATGSGSSGVASSPPDVVMSFSVNGYDYKIFSDSLEGDFCQVYKGERTSATGDLEKICLKVPFEADDNGLMKNESEILRKVAHKSMPVLLDSFQMEDGRYANAIREIEESYDLCALREYFPDGLPQEHAVWVMDRLLSVIGYLHINTIVHGAIEPGNIMITPYNHNGLAIDYLLAVQDANKSGAEYVGVNDYSAPEVEDGAAPHPAADMYSLGKSMVYLMGGDVDKLELPSSVDPRIKDFVGKFLCEDPEDRYDDAWSAWHELKELRTEVFGAPSQFLELKINNIGGR